MLGLKSRFMLVCCLSSERSDFSPEGFPLLLQTQSTLLQMTGAKTANKRNTEPAVDQQKPADGPPPASPAENTENKR